MLRSADDGRRREVLDQVIELVVLFNEDMTRSLARDGLTVSRAGVVWMLRRQGPSTQRSLADALDVSARTVTGLVDGLVGTGFVTREPHPTDRRATLVTLTPHGARVAADLDEAQGELAEQLFGSMAPRRFAAFAAGLDEVLATLRLLLEEQAGGGAPAGGERGASERGAGALGTGALGSGALGSGAASGRREEAT